MTDVSQHTTIDLFPLADRLRKLKERRKRIEEALSGLKAKIKDTEDKLADAMLMAECGNFTRDGQMFSLTTTSFWSASEGGTEALYSALRENGHDYLFTVNAKRLGSFLREAVNATEDENGETHIPDWLAGLIKSYDKPGITMRSVPKKLKK
jgi:hypothetical protein